MEIYEMTQSFFDENEEVANSVLNVTDIINNIDDNEIENINYNLVIENTLVNITKLTSHLLSKSEALEDKLTKETIKNDESVGSLTFLDEFVRKIDNLTLEDFIDKEIDSLNSTTQFLKKYYDLKSWRPKGEYNVASRRNFAQTTTISKYPFLVSINVQGEFICAGSIISKNLVISAAACLQSVYQNRFLPDHLPSVSIRLGSDYIGKLGEVIQIITIFFHPQYNPAYFKNNLVILKMEKHTYFRRNRSLRRIDFDKKSQSLLGNTKHVVVLGWGTMSAKQNEVLNKKLSYKKLNMFNLEKCKEIYSSKYIVGSNFCASFAANKSCNGDIGGPAIVDGVLVGMISFGPSRCHANSSPTVFTKLSCYSHWIQRVIGEETSTILQHTEFIQNATLSVTMPTTKKKSLRGFLGHPDEDIKKYPIEMQIIRNALLSQSKYLLKDIINNSSHSSIRYSEMENESPKARNNALKHLFPYDKSMSLTTPRHVVKKNETNITILIKDNKIKKMHNSSTNNKASELINKKVDANDKNIINYKLPENYESISLSSESEYTEELSIEIEDLNKDSHEEDDIFLHKHNEIREITTKKKIENNYIKKSQDKIKANANQKFKNVIQKIPRKITQRQFRKFNI